jgi:hypothetical protein
MSRACFIDGVFVKNSSEKSSIATNLERSNASVATASIANRNNSDFASRMLIREDIFK